MVNQEPWEIAERKERLKALEDRITRTDAGSEFAARVRSIGKKRRVTVRVLHRGDHGDDVRKLQQAIGKRARARDAPNHVPKVDGNLGPETLADLHYVCYLLGMDTTHLKNLLKAGITPAEQTFVRNPGKRDKATLDRARRRVAAHRKVRAQMKKDAAKASAKRQKIVAEATQAAANYRKQPGAYHYLAGGVANLIFLKPSPSNFRSDCSQFAASVYKAAGLPSPASVPHEWASTFTMVKAPGVKVVDKAHRKPGMLGMYGSRTAPHHVEIWCGDRFIGHGSPPIDSLTPGEPDYYLDFPFLN